MIAAVKLLTSNPKSMEDRSSTFPFPPGGGGFRYKSLKQLVKMMLAFGPLTLDELKAALLTAALIRHQGNKYAVARELGINSKTPYKMARKYGIEIVNRNPFKAKIKCQN